MSAFHLQETSNASPRVKKRPLTSSIPVPFTYYSSDDGTDENLLLLLHGLGDTHAPFARIPFLYEEAYQWYTSFDELGEMIEHPNPTPALEVLTQVINHLTKDLKWPLDRIHFFGFAQGGSVAAEFCLLKWKEQLQAERAAIASSANESQAASLPTTSLGSVISVSGPLLSYPTISVPSPTPVLLAYRRPPSEDALPTNAIKSFQKGFQSVVETSLGSKGRGMPASKEEWEPIMRFWSQKLARRQMDGLYEVMSGLST